MDASDINDRDIQPPWNKYSAAAIFRTSFSFSKENLKFRFTAALNSKLLLFLFFIIVAFIKDVRK